eukprot:3434423-Lingulodinium_polyedra.AAC.1
MKVRWTGLFFMKVRWTGLLVLEVAMDSQSLHGPPSSNEQLGEKAHHVHGTVAAAALASFGARCTRALLGLHGRTTDALLDHGCQCLALVGTQQPSERVEALQLMQRHRAARRHGGL